MEKQLVCCYRAKRKKYRWSEKRRKTL